jgi:osmoprotectant transport system permease protein
MDYLVQHPGVVAWRLLQHIELVGGALAIACAIALPLGVLVARKRRTGGVILAVLNAIYTIPSLALFALLIPLLGIGTWTALVALVLYAQMVLVRNVAVGLRGVSPALVDAARGLGMSPVQIFTRVEVPQALPVIIGGVRLASIALISLATLASWIDAGGLGALVLYGLQHDDPSRAVAGAIAAAALAIAVDVVLRTLQRRWSHGNAAPASAA